MSEDKNKEQEQEKAKEKAEAKKGQKDCPPQIPGKGRCPACGERHV